MNNVCKPKDDSVCQLADAILILILEIIGIALAICVVIGLIVVGILCYCKKQRKKDDKKLIMESHERYAKHNAMIDAERE